MKLFLLMVAMLSTLFMADLAVASDKVDVNTATVEQLQTVKGIGPKTAESIVEYRKEHGKFASISALTEVKGIGEKSLKKLQGSLKAGEEKSKADKK